MSETKRFTRAEVAARDPKEDNVFIIDNLVYNVKSFLDEHPGGHEVLLRVAGKDASEDFADIGHSLDAKALMQKFQIGELVEEEKTREIRKPGFTNVQTVTETSDNDIFGSWKLPLVLGLLATVLYTYLFS